MTGQKSLKILFIGNSFTARNNLPQMFESMAGEVGVKINHDLINVGGASLRTHSNKGKAQKQITAKQYNYVVLQEQSTLPAKNAARMHENVRLFDQAITESGAKTVLYMTWSRKLEPQNQAKITDAYTMIGKETGAIVVPVGVAWQKFRKRHIEPELYDRDGSHPTAAGTFLAACVFVATLLKCSRVDVSTTIPGISLAEAQLLAKQVFTKE